MSNNRRPAPAGHNRTAPFRARPRPEGSRGPEPAVLIRKADLIAAVVVLWLAGCARGAATEAPPPPPSPELSWVPAGAAAVVRVDLSGAAGPFAVEALGEASAERLGCLREMLPDLKRVAVALVPRGREFAAWLLVDGVVSRAAIDACGEDLAKAFAQRPLPDGASPAVQPLPGGAGKGDAPGSWIVALDLDVERQPAGLGGPVAAAYTRLAGWPIVLAVGGGESLRNLSGMAATYLPLSSMGEAADRIAALAYGIQPRADGTADILVEVDCVDDASAAALARQVRQVGRIAALDGEGAAWADLRDMVRELRAEVVGGGRRVEARAVLTAAGLRALVR
ncbi:MAG: hypothetical protein HY907_02570 [Deltaproteobacteria bacterium]|nr:hypothetical protein [Deltaproteobacteria bacterium]